MFLHYRIMAFGIGLLAFVLSVVWLGWKFTLVLWLAMWANNLRMATRFRDDAGASGWLAGEDQREGE